jgi:hypothetical protein
MKFSSIGHIKPHQFIAVKRLKASFGSKIKKKISWPNRLRLSLKAKSVLSVVIIVVLLVSIFAFISKQTPSKPIEPTNTDSPTAPPTAAPQNNSKPTSKPTPIPNVLTGIGNALIQVFTPPKAPGFIETSTGMNSTIWRQVAAAAWQYFQPGIGVDENTSLPNSGSGSPYFTDWDLGVYIQAVMDANATGLIGYNGTWGSSARLENIVHWLETRELNATTHYPYWFYQSSDGSNYHPMSDLSTSLVDGVDTGRLFVALNNLRIFNSSLAPRINNITLYGQNYNRSNYAALVPSIYTECLYSNSIYAYYVYSGFASFWPDQLSSVPNRILSNILSSGNVTTNNVTLPISTILGDPLLGSVFDLNNNSSQLMYIMHQVYLAHEAYYNATTPHVFRAFSEGASLDYHWTYEWVVLGNQTWVILDENNQPFSISPIVYTKIALGFLAIYNTTYAYNLNVYLEKALPAPEHGYSEGVNEDKQQLTGTGSNTNGLILGAAKYAIQNNP